MSKPSCFISGVAGRIGAALAQRLLDAGYEIGGCDSLVFGYEKNVPAGINFRKLPVEFIPTPDINKYDILMSCHTANIVYGMDNPISTWETNCTNTIDAFRRFKGKIINLSTSSVYGNATVLPTPETAEISLTNSYARSKYTSELFLQDRGNYTNFRLSNTFGGIEQPDYPYLSVISKMIVDALKGNPQTIIGDGSQTRDFVYCQDVIDAVMLCIEQPAHNETFNIASGNETSIMEVTAMVNYHTGDKHSMLSVDKRPIDNVTRRCLNIEKANYKLGWQPKTSLEDGLRKAITWYKQQLNVG